MLDLVFFTLPCVGLVLVIILRASQRALLRSHPPVLRAEPKGVSILKPLKGVDNHLEENLRSFFELDWPCYELVLGSDDPEDPALDVARRVAREHAHVRATIVADRRRVGLNPKVNNLANLARRASNEILVVSDSNVAVPADYLRGLVARLESPSVGLVSSPVRAVDGRGLGGAFESLHLNTFAMGGVAATHLVLRRPCVLGKSMAFRRADLGRIGGFEHLSRFLDEDQVCGEEMVRLDRRTDVTSNPIDNVLGFVAPSQFVRRHLRWALIRRQFSGAAYAGEILLNPIALAVLGLLGGSAGLAHGLVLGAAIGTKASLDASAERSLGIRRPWWSYLALVPAKDLLLAVVFPVPFLRSTVSWRGSSFRVGRRTRLKPLRSTRALAAEGRIEPEPIPVA